MGLFSRSWFNTPLSYLAVFVFVVVVRLFGIPNLFVYLLTTLLLTLGLINRAIYSAKM